MRNTIQTGALFIIRSQDMPRRPFGVGGLQHRVTGSRIFKPLAARREIYRAELPLAHRVFDSRLEPPLLLLVAHFEPDLDELDVGVHDEFLHYWTAFEKFPMLLGGAEPHHILDAR